MAAVAAPPDLDSLLEPHPHARAVLGPALVPGGAPSHAYLFHGPPATGKRTVAAAVAATLLAEGAADPAGTRARVERGAHPDLTWVAPSGAQEMLVADVEEPVVAAASHTPFEGSRRVFVLERVETLQASAANRMLKTLEEPADFVHLVLLTEHLGEVLETISSRCQLVRFDPRPVDAVAAGVAERMGAEPRTALAAARLAPGDARTAAWLAGAEGSAIREQAELFARCALDGTMAARRPWLELLSAAGERGRAAGERAAEGLEEAKALVPRKEHRRLERESAERVRRAERRDRGAALDLALALAGRWYRDVAAVAWGAPELAANADREDPLARDAAGRDPQRLRAAVELVEDTRARARLFVDYELACEVLGHRLSGLLAA